MMLVAEQQAKLGICAEESKAQRLKRQQSRFRDRGGAFVPSNLNPLVDILLARTVSGESPSKARSKDVVAKHPRKSRQTSPTRKAATATVAEESQPVAGSSKSKAQASRKRKAKVVEPEVDPASKPAPKRRGRPPKAQKKVPDVEIDTEQFPPNTNAKATSKGKGKQDNTAPATSDGKSKPKPRAKPNPTKPVVEVLASDDDRTLVEVPHKTKTNPKSKVLYRDDGETDDDAPLVRNRVLPPAGELQMSGTKTVTGVKTLGAGSSGKKAGGGPASVQVGKVPKTNAKKRLAPYDDDDDDDEEVEIAAPAPKKGKTTKLATAKTKHVTEPEPELEPAPRTIKDTEFSENSKAAGRGKSKNRVESDSAIVKPVVGDDGRPPVLKLKKRKEEDNYDDRPRKIVKFSDTGPPHSSSKKLKENQSDTKHKSAAEASVQDELDALRPELTTKPPSRSKASKGPPLEVLERIKASAAQHLNHADSEPDELDCLS